MNMQTSLTSLIISKKLAEKSITFIKNDRSENRISYSLMYNRAVNCLHYLQSAGLKPGSKAVLHIEDEERYICTLWACILGGIVSVPFTVGNTHEHILRISKVWDALDDGYFITDNNSYNNLISLSGESAYNFKSRLMGKVIISEDLVKGNKMGSIYYPDINDTAIILFTSGSTGEPKGIILSHKNIIENINSTIDRLKLTSNDSFLNWMPLTHSAGLTLFHFPSIQAEMDQYIMSKNQFVIMPLLWLQKAHEYKVTFLFGSNFALKHFLDNVKDEEILGLDLSSIRGIINSAETISAKTALLFMDKLSCCYLKKTAMTTSYGMTETCSICCSEPDEEIKIFRIRRDSLAPGLKIIVGDSENEYLELVSVGQPMKHHNVRICDDAGSILEENVVGHIQVKGPGVTPGYYGKKTDSGMAFTNDGWLITGDIGFRNGGSVVIAGRSKDVIIINGQNYYSHDIERVIQGIEGLESVKVAACGVFNKATQQEELVIFIEYRKGIEEFVDIAQRVKNHVGSRVGVETREIIPVEAMPTTGNGKLQRFRLIQDLNEHKCDELINEIHKILQTMSKDKIFTYPRNILEEKIHSIWCDVLGTKDIGINDSFFDLGGDSIKAIKVLERTNSLHINISTADIYGYKTISRLCEHVLKDNKLGDKFYCNVMKFSGRDNEFLRNYNKNFSEKPTYIDYYSCWGFAIGEKLEYEYSIEIETSFIEAAKGAHIIWNGYALNGEKESILELKDMWLCEEGVIPDLLRKHGITTRFISFESLEKGIDYCVQCLKNNRLVIVEAIFYYMNYSGFYRVDEKQWMRNYEKTIEKAYPLLKPFQMDHIVLLVDITDEGYLVSDIAMRFFGEIEKDNFHSAFAGSKGMECFRKEPVWDLLNSYRIIEVDVVSKIDVKELARDIFLSTVDLYTSDESVVLTEGVHVPYKVNMGLIGLKELINVIETFGYSKEYYKKLRELLIYYLREWDKKYMTLKLFFRDFRKYFNLPEEVLVEVEFARERFSDLQYKLENNIIPNEKYTYKNIGIDLSGVYIRQKTLFSELRKIARELSPVNSSIVL
ncbi:MAG: AMP-binding protein [Clostridia bacterium]|nr:AMP-binding protein [Clostridia bacterium]